MSLYESIDQTDIDQAYAVIIDDTRQLLLDYSHHNGWSLPCKIVITLYNTEMTDRDKLATYLAATYGSEIKIDRLLAVEAIHNSIPNHESEHYGFVINSRYATYYLCRTSSVETKNGCWFKISKLVSQSIYAKYRNVLDEIYKNHKINLFLDIDNTILESVQLIKDDEKPSIEEGKVNSDTFVLHSGLHPPDGIAYLDKSHTRLIWKRPYFDYFYHKVLDLTNLHFWTAGTIDCQEPVLSSIGVTSYDIFCRRYCGGLKSENSSYNKFFSTLFAMTGSRFVGRRCLLVDDLSHNCIYNPYNSYQIPGWAIAHASDAKQLANILMDRALLDLLDYIMQMTDSIIHATPSVGASASSPASASVSAGAS